MSKVIFLADVHVDCGGKCDDVLWALTGVAGYAYKNGITQLIILGDLFHDRNNLSIEVMCKIFDFFDKCKRLGQNWIVFPGNHDMFLKHSWKINSLKPLKHLLTVINDISLIKLDNRRFWIIPFIYSESAYMEILKHIERNFWQPNDVLLTHIGVTDAELNSCFLLQNWSLINFNNSKFDQVFTGHFHLHQKVGNNCVYAGSLVPFKISEGDSDHGFLVYDLITRNYEFMDIFKIAPEFNVDKKVPPKYFTIPHEDVVNAPNEIINNNIIRVALTNDLSNNDRIKLRDQLISSGARQVTFIELYDHNEIAEEEAKAIPFENLFVTWLDHDHNSSNYDKSNLVRLDIDIRHEGDSKYLDAISLQE